MNLKPFDMTFELTWNSNGFNYSQDFMSIEEALNEFWRLSDFNPKIIVITKDGNFNYEIDFNGFKSYVKYIAKPNTGCVSGAWGSIDRLIAMINGRNFIIHA